jgi:alkanesulfonate monooxygenase SsuD/methylene tetrahydromethanopterin reductase-like flavin-dependent oxidoreductase (luciferase family)
MEEEFQNLGQSFRGRGKRFEEAINLIRTLHGNESPQFRGQYHEFNDAVFKPKPRRDVGPPIWFGGNSEVALRRAAKLADGWHPVGVTLENYRVSVQKIKSLLPHAKPFMFSLRIHIDIDGKTEPYRASSGERRTVIAGPVDRAINQIQVYRDAGLEHLVCYFGDIELKLLKKKITQFAQEIMPSFQK